MTPAPTSTTLDAVVTFGLAFLAYALTYGPVHFRKVRAYLKARRGREGR